MDDIRQSSLSGLKTIKEERVRITNRDGQDKFHVTSILDILPDAPGIAIWKRKADPALVQKTLDEARARGTHIHTMIENHFLGKAYAIPKDDPKVDKLVTGWNTFLAMHGNDIKPIYIPDTHEELSVENTLTLEGVPIIGTPDMIGEWKGVLSCIDYKTSSVASFNPLDEYKYFLQTRIYMHMWNTLHPSRLVKQLVLIPFTYARKSGLGNIVVKNDPLELDILFKDFMYIFNTFQNNYSLIKEQ